MAFRIRRCDVLRGDGPALQLQLLIENRLTLAHGDNACSRICKAFHNGAVGGAQKGGHDLRLLGNQLAGRQDRIAIQMNARIAVAQDGKLLGLDARKQRHGRVMEISGRIHIATHHDVVAGRELRGGPGKQIGRQALAPRHHGPGTACGLHGGGGHFFALEAGEVRGDASVLAPDDDKRRPVVVLIDGLHTRCASVLRIELDQRTDIAQTHLVGTAGDARYRSHRARAHVQTDIQPFVTVVAVLLRQKERCRLTIDTEIQREFQRSQRLALGMYPGRSAKRQGSKEMATLHGGTLRSLAAKTPAAAPLAGHEQFPGAAQMQAERFYS